MTPQLATGFAQSTSRSFIDQLVKAGLIKDGFQGVLGSKSLLEIEQYLLEHRLINQEQLHQQLASFLHLEYIDLLNRSIPSSALSVLPLELAKKYQIAPYDMQGLDVYLAVANPAALQNGAPSALADIRAQKGLRLHLAVAPAAEVAALLQKIEQTVPEPVVAEDAPPLPPPPVQSSVPTNQPASQTGPVKALNKQDLINEVEPRTKTVDLRTVNIPAATLNKIPVDVASKYKLIVFESRAPSTNLEPPIVKVAAVNPDDQHVKEILAYIEQRNKVLVEVYQTSPASLEAGLALYQQPAAAPAVAPPTEAMPAAPVTSQPVSAHAAEPTTPTADAVPPPPVPSSVAAKPQSVSAPTTALVVTESEITALPSQAGGEDLKRLAAEQQRSLEDQNLDRLLKTKIESPEQLAEVFKGGVIPEIVAATLFLGIRMRASDIHLEAERDTVRVRFRIDGILHDILTVPKFLHAPLISRIKILSKMKIDEQRVPQDGRFDVIIDARQVDLRVSTMPTVHGEKIVMRLLDKSEGIKSLEQLGVTGTNFDLLVKNINKPFGVILSTGPTGSGKSTTLYAVLTRISKPGVNIVTLEDPVEYELPGINQAQVKPQIGFTFADGLRSVLRQDPNVIMVGEIRDLETAGMATQAALTGHLVLSTLHTNDASGALPRLIDMGVEPFLITSSINCVIGQRLVRRICEDCREEVTIPEAVKTFITKQLAELPSGQLQDVDVNQLRFYHGRGCPNCTNGYRGRIGIFEVLAMSDAIEELAVRKAPASELKKQAIAEGMVTMVQDGLIKALKGITTVDEVMRVTTTSFKELPEIPEG